MVLCTLLLWGCATEEYYPHEGLASTAEPGQSADVDSTVDALCLRGEDYFMAQQYDLAIADLTAAIQLMDAEGATTDVGLLAVACKCRAKCHLALERYDLAITDFTRAIELKPDDGQAYVLRAHAHLMRGDTTQARPDLERASELGAPEATAGLDLLDFFEE
jgi:Flp pilus assembly protein TadD